MPKVLLSLFTLLLIASPVRAVSWEQSCTPFTDGCLFTIASKELEDPTSSKGKHTLNEMAFHAGRLGFESIPGGDLDFAPEDIAAVADQFHALGEDVSNDRVELNLEKPVVGHKAILIAPYVLPEQVDDLGQDEVLNILRASELPISVQGAVLGRLLVKELNRGSYRFANGEADGYVEYLDSSAAPFLGITSLAIVLAEEGYTREAKDVVNRKLTTRDHVLAQDVLLYIRSIQAVFDGDPLLVVSISSAIQATTLRLEALGHLFTMTNDQFIGKQFLSALYDYASPLSPTQRLNIVLFTISESDRTE